MFVNKISVEKRPFGTKYNVALNGVCSTEELETLYDHINTSTRVIELKIARKQDDSLASKKLEKHKQVIIDELIHNVDTTFSRTFIEVDITRMDPRILVAVREHFASAGFNLDRITRGSNEYLKISW